MKNIVILILLVNLFTYSLAAQDKSVSDTLNVNPIARPVDITKYKSLNTYRPVMIYTLTNEDEDFELDNYDWKWEPYIKKLKEKVMDKWQAPDNYTKYGIGSGHTKVKFTINRNGTLKNIMVTEQVGDSLFQKFSLEAIKSAFPFLSLPNSFSDSTLTITSKMIYPDLQKLYRQKHKNKLNSPY